LKSVYTGKIIFVKHNLMIVDFHTHTFVSKDCLTTPEQLIAASRRKGIDRVVITDHNTIVGALIAQKLAPELVIVGEEIMTTRGEILAAFVTEEVPPGLSPQETIRCLRQQGAFISVSHPFDRWRSGAWRLEDLLEIAPLVDAIEVFNARCLSRQDNLKAQTFARQHGLRGTAGSDAHTLAEIGAAYLVSAPFDGPDGMRIATEHARIQGWLSPFWVHFSSTYARYYKRLMGKKTLDIPHQA
jgi:predicted metal-dependent phosphoesterase TrpH